ELENFSGKTKVSVLQDFYATIYMANIISFAAEEADALIADKDEGKKLKYKRKANRNRCVSKFRERFIRILLSVPGNYGRLLDDANFIKERFADVASAPYL
ncbi:MAG: hypothetical protein LBS19_00930, partial [Clostridiales bacterium]|nr:hypothetical protein [Clostridiales bacterium]